MVLSFFLCDLNVTLTKCICAKCSIFVPTWTQVITHLHLVKMLPPCMWNAVTFSITLESLTFFGKEKNDLPIYHCHQNPSLSLTTLSLKCSKYAPPVLHTAAIAHMPTADRNAWRMPEGQKRRSFYIPGMTLPFQDGLIFRCVLPLQLTTVYESLLLSV